jgi:hypothetical protein
MNIGEYCPEHYIILYFERHMFFFYNLFISSFNSHPQEHPSVLLLYVVYYLYRPSVINHNNVIILFSLYKKKWEKKVTNYWTCTYWKVNIRNEKTRLTNK